MKRAYALEGIMRMCIHCRNLILIRFLGGADYGGRCGWGRRRRPVRGMVEPPQESGSDLLF